jgi:transketolase
MMKKRKIKNIDELSVAAIRATCIDGINLAKSGHPGAALSSAPILYVLYKDFFVSNPFQADRINRDRFVLSCGHASMLLYTILHLCSYDISLEDLEKFRQYGSITPGHPEVYKTPGIDASTGPLGQGIAEAVGIAMAETMLAAKYGTRLYDHYTYCLCGDGCLEEGISQEAISFAGTTKAE